MVYRLRGETWMALEGELEIDIGLSLEGVEDPVAVEWKPKENDTSGVGGRTLIDGPKCGKLGVLIEAAETSCCLEVVCVSVGRVNDVSKGASCGLLYDSAD